MGSPRSSPEPGTLELLLPEVRRFARTLDSARIDREASLGADVIAAAADLGLFGLAIEVEHGGLGLDLGETCEVIATVAEHDRSVATSLGLHAGLGSRPLVTLGSDAQKRRYLPSMASGACVASFAATEAGAGSDLMAIRTTIAEDASSFVLEGEKHYVTNGGFAGVFTVLARGPLGHGKSAHSLVCVPRERTGLTIGKEEEKLGLKGSSTVSVAFDGVRLAKEDLLEPAGHGMEQAHAALAWGRTLMSAGSVGLARAAFSAAREHVRTRRQFGRTLGSFGAVKAQLAEMAARLFAMEALVDEVGRREREGRAIASLSSSAKVFCSEGSHALADRSVQLHGALGYLEDSGVPRLLRDCRVSRIFEGANDVLLVLAGTELLGRNALPELPSLPSPDLADARDAWASTVEELGRTVEEAKRRHGLRLVREQTWLASVARAQIGLEAAAAALARPATTTELGAMLARHAVTILVSEARRSLGHAARSFTVAADEQRLASALLESFDPALPARRGLSPRWSA
ncbi:MAG: acyl-CoA dehydrogenase family protein [Polyangiales bacterium]